MKNNKLKNPLKNLEKAVKTENIEEIESATKALNDVLTPLSSKLYNQNEQQNNSDDQSDEKPEDNTVDADFEEVKEDK